MDRTSHQKSNTGKKEPFARRLCELLFCCFFVMILGGVGLLSVLDEDPTVSDRENRSLKTYPPFSVETLLDGTYFRQTEEAYNDTFPARDEFVRIHAALTQGLMFHTEQGVVIKADSEVSFFSEDDEFTPPPILPAATEGPETTDPASPTETPAEAGPASPTETPAEASPALPTETPTPVFVFSAEGYEAFRQTGNGLVGDDMGILIRYGRAMHEFVGSARCAERFTTAIYWVSQSFPQLRVISVLAPEAGAFYAGDAYNFGQSDQKAYIDLIRENLDGYVLQPDVYAKLEEHQDEDIYFRTDHHWTVMGAYYAYEAIAEELDFEPVPLDGLEQVDRPGFLGSLYNKTRSPVLEARPDVLSYFIPPVAVEVEYHQDRQDLGPSDVGGLFYDTKSWNLYRTFIRGDSPLCIITTDAGTGRSALLIKNSYANALIPFLCNHYDRLYVLDPRHLNTFETNRLELAPFLAEHPVDDLYFIFCTRYASDAGTIRAIERLVYGVSEPLPMPTPAPSDTPKGEN